MADGWPENAKPDVRWVLVASAVMGVGVVLLIIGALTSTALAFIGLAVLLGGMVVQLQAYLAWRRKQLAEIRRRRDLPGQ